MKKLLLILFLGTVMSACTDNAGTIKTLERSGYKPLNVGGYSFFGGSEGDLYKTKFRAIAPNGDTVTGTVTKGIMKGNTIRTDD